MGAQSGGARNLEFSTNDSSMLIIIFLLCFLGEDEESEDSLEHSPSPAREPEDDEEGEKGTSKVMTAEELQEKLTKKKEAISLVVSQLMENPEGNVS